MNGKIKIAYLVIAHTDPEQLKRLVKRLTESADVYIHINASVDIVPFQKGLKNIDVKGKIEFSRERYRVVWGGYYIVKAALSLLGQAFQSGKYDRFVLLTGLDYPIKTDVQIQDFFQEHLHTEFVCADVVTGEKKALDHLYYYAARDHKFIHRLLKQYEKLLRFLHRKGKKDYVVHRGKKYPIYGIAPKWAVSWECAEYLLNFYRTEKKFNRYFQFMHAPDDFYVATVLYNSEFRDRIETGKDIFKTLWLPKDKGAKILTEEDAPELLGCGQLYAKKFQTGHSEKLQQILDGEM